MKKNMGYFKHYVSIFAALALMNFLMFSSCKKDDNKPDNPGTGAVTMFEGTARLSSDNVSSNATGSVTGKYDPATKKLSYTFQWNNLTGTIGGFHIHKGDGAIIINFKDAGYTTATSGTFTGEATLTDEAWIQDLMAGKLYGQIHTEKYPRGEIIFPFTKKGSSSDGGGYTPPVY